jgi:Flp pilus assembly protein TadG
MIRRLIKLAREERGAAVIELALIAPILAIIIMGVTDVSIAYGRRLELEQAVQRSIEKVMQTTGDTTVAGTIQKEAVCQINGTNPDGTCASGRLTTAEVTVTYRLECTDGAGALSTQETGDADTFDAYTCPNTTDTEARYIMATALDTYTPMFNVHFGTGPDGVYDMSATAGVRVQ